MKTYSFSHTIQAPAQSVIEIIYDIKNYNSWNRCLQYQNGKMQEGEKLILQATLDGKKFIKWPCKVEQLHNDGFVLSKSIIAKPYMHMIHSFKVKPLNEKSCEVIHTWNGTGFSPRFFWDKIIPVLDKFKPYNESLKTYAENKNNI
ncbi:hypothetical protein KFE94_07695 [bacterium SCSIO 12643]|nr:hypothetical protein KFE94_07695 [bacterium SCSIO 12643]